MIKFNLHHEKNNSNCIALFKNSFSFAYNEEEGRSVAKLVHDLFEDAASSSDNIYCFTAKDGDALIGAVFFSRLRFYKPVNTFILSPMAVATKYQKKGIGQQLILNGLETLKKDGVELVMTYGDPTFYTKTGFRQVRESTIKAPFPLSQPEGWLCKLLQNEAIPELNKPPACVCALNNPDYW